MRRLIQILLWTQQLSVLAFLVYVIRYLAMPGVGSAQTMLIAAIPGLLLFLVLLSLPGEVQVTTPAEAIGQAARKLWRLSRPAGKSTRLEPPSGS
jgi:hypothetical protein